MKQNVTVIIENQVRDVVVQSSMLTLYGGADQHNLQTNRTFRWRDLKWGGPRPGPYIGDIRSIINMNSEVQTSVEVFAKVNMMHFQLIHLQIITSYFTMDVPRNTKNYTGDPTNQ